MQTAVTVGLGAYLNINFTRPTFKNKFLLCIKLFIEEMNT